MKKSTKSHQDYPANVVHCVQILLHHLGCTLCSAQTVDSNESDGYLDLLRSCVELIEGSEQEIAPILQFPFTLQFAKQFAENSHKTYTTLHFVSSILQGAVGLIHYILVRHGKKV